jgi:hypothetical protein
MKKRLILSAVAASVSLTALGGTAYADIRPADEASPVIEISKADKTGDVRVERYKTANVSNRIKQSVAMDHVDYRVDRTAQTLTVTYPLQKVLTNDRYRQFAITMIATDRDHLERSQVVLVMSAAHKSRVVAVNLDSEYEEKRCAGGSSVTDTAADTITQTVPFSCLGGLDHGSLRSFVGVESVKGRDIAWDVTRFTRDVPLRAYVAPPTDPAPTDPAPTDPDPVDPAPADFAPFN